jgi:hypothetical protein
MSEINIEKLKGKGSLEQQKIPEGELEQKLEEIGKNFDDAKKALDGKGTLQEKIRSSLGKAKIAISLLLALTKGFDAKASLDINTTDPSKEGTEVVKSDGVAISSNNEVAEDTKDLSDLFAKGDPEKKKGIEKIETKEAIEKTNLDYETDFKFAEYKLSDDARKLLEKESLGFVNNLSEETINKIKNHQGVLVVEAATDPVKVIKVGTATNNLELAQLRAYEIEKTVKSALKQKGITTQLLLLKYQELKI